MNFEAEELAQVSCLPARTGIRWGSVFAGISVGIATYALILLIGVCIGMARGGGFGGDGSGAVLAWNLMSALAASLLGTFVAASSADLRSAAAGAQHGLVVWGCAALLVMFGALFLVRDVAGNVAMQLALNTSRSATLTQDERDVDWNGRLRQTSYHATGARFQSTAMADDRPAGAWMGTQPAFGQRDYMNASEPQAGAGTVRISAYAALMLCASMAISLFGSIAGGLLGTGAPRRRVVTRRSREDIWLNDPA